MKRVALALVALFGITHAAHSQYVTLSGTLQSSNGLPASNYVVNFTPSQFGYIAGTGVVINTSTACATSTDGSVVGLPNPLVKPPVTVAFTGTLPPSNYYVKFGFYDASGNLTLVSPETVIQLNSTGRLIVAPPTSGLPAGAVGMKVYISTTTNAETLQGASTGSGAFIQSVPLVTGAAVPGTNTTVCKQVANDAIWPTGTGYTVSMTDPSGNTIPGYPMMWQLMGPNTTINLSSGLPYYHGTVYFPTPILASPLNHALQTISGPLGMSGYNLLNVGALGVGTSLPAWPIDVENGSINASGGYIYNGGTGVTAGQCLVAGSDAFHIFGPAACSSSPTVYYQTAQLAGSSLAQRGKLNFLAPLTAVDNAGNNSTDVGLSPTGTAGTYTNPVSITTDTYGRISAVTASSATSRSCVTAGCYLTLPDGTIIQWGVVTGCGGSASCNVTATFPTAFTTTSNLVVTVSEAGGGANNFTAGTNGMPSTTGFTVQYAALVFVGGGGSNLSGSQTANYIAIGH